GIGDVYWTCGDGFRLDVYPVNTADNATIDFDESYKNVPAGFYYSTKNGTTTETTTVYTSSKDAAPYVEQMKSLTEIRGADHFYPDETNGGEGRNLYFEYSFLWNQTLQNWDYDKSLAEIKVVTLQQNNGGARGNHRELYYLYTRNNNNPFKTSDDCPFAGHFDYSTYKSDALKKDNAYDLSDEGITFRGNSVGQYVAGWGESPKQRSYSPYISDSENDPMNGWHHIGVLIHQEAAPTGEKNVSYSGWSELFIDGVKVWKVQIDMESDAKSNGKYTSLKRNGLLLFTATANNGEITGYSDPPDTVEIGYRLDAFKATTTVYAVFADARWRIVDTDFNPSSEIEPVATPVAATYTLPNGTEVPADVYFRAK
ncbi:MAG: hypothetical protein IKP74_07545, partial [Clostridia bacterium]|nr:hypothetical protein [Clostridia bacterium]